MPPRHFDQMLSTPTKTVRCWDCLIVGYLGPVGGCETASPQAVARPHQAIDQPRPAHSHSALCWRICDHLPNRPFGSVQRRTSQVADYSRDLRSRSNTATRHRKPPKPLASQTPRKYVSLYCLISHGPVGFAPWWSGSALVGVWPIWGEGAIHV